jgi:hypothetical protein
MTSNHISLFSPPHLQTPNLIGITIVFRQEDTAIALGQVNLYFGHLAQTIA